jgi:hypothetical protein
VDEVGHAVLASRKGGNAIQIPQQLRMCGPGPAANQSDMSS